MKKILSLIFAVLIVFTAAPFLPGIIADAATSGVFEYTVYDDCVSITSIKPSAKKVVIPEKIGGKPVTGINYWIFYDCPNITSLTIPSGISIFESYGLYASENLTEIIVSDKNKSYSSYNGMLFNKDKTQLLYCPRGKKGSITVPANVLSISANFTFCPKLTTINVNANNKTFASVDGILYNKNKTELISCPGGKSGKVAVSSKVTNINYYAFSGCEKITAINVNSNNKTYSSLDGVVYNKKKTSVIILPKNKTGTWTVPASVKEIYTYDLAYGNNSLTKINVNANNKTYSSIDGVLYNKNKTELILCPNKKSGKLTIPDKTKYISDFALTDCGKITAIHIGAGLCPPKAGTSYTAIDGSNFSGCTSLKTVTVSSKNKYYSTKGGAIYNKKKTELIATMPLTTSLVIPSTVKTLGYHSVSFSNVKNVTIPNSVTSIAYFSFSGCSKLTSIKIPNKLKTIDYDTFLDCDNLRSVTIPKSVKAINGYAFENCPKLGKVYYAGTKAQYNSINNAYSGLKSVKVTYNSKGCTSHKFKSTSTCICSNCGYTETAKCLKKVNGVWYYFNNGVKDKSNTLVKHTNGVLYHVKGGKRVNDTAIVKYSGKRYYVKNGYVNKVSKTVKVGGKYYKLKKGVVV